MRYKNCALEPVLPVPLSSFAAIRISNMTGTSRPSTDIAVKIHAGRWIARLALASGACQIVRQLVLEQVHEIRFGACDVLLRQKHRLVSIAAAYRLGNRLVLVPNG